MVKLGVFLAFLVVPLIEIYALIQVGQVIGAWWTVLILVADSLLGAWLVRREWRGTWAALRRATGAGQLPNRELADAALVVVGGTLLLTPGFLTDLLGFFLLLPLTRPIVRRALLSFVARRVQLRAARWTPGGSVRSGPVIRGHVVDDRPVALARQGWCESPSGQHANGPDPGGVRAARGWSSRSYDRAFQADLR